MSGRGVGDILRIQRVQRGLTAAQAAEAAHLPRWVVHGLERDTLATDDVKTTAYLRMYARSLGLDAEALLLTLAGNDPGEQADGVGERGQQAATGGRGQKAAIVERVQQAATGRRGQRLAALFVTALLVGMVIAGVLANDGVPNRSPAASPASDTVVLDGEAPAGRLDADAGGDGRGAVHAAAPSPRPDTDEDGNDPAPRGEPEPAVPGRAPGQTRVQVLHDGANQATVDEVVGVLRALGYDVVIASAARGSFPSTTVFYGQGWELEAEGLRTRDARFGVVQANDRFSDELDLHVGIGPDWPRPPVEVPDPVPEPGR